MAATRDGRRDGRWAFVVTGLLAAGCNCGGEGLKKLGDGQIAILSPADGATADALVHFEAKAQSSLGLKWVSLRVGTDEIFSCPPGADNTEISCAKDFNLSDEIAQAENGALTLTAVAKDESDNTLQKSVKIVAAPLTVLFKQPVGAGDPPVAKVRGTSAVTLEVHSLIAVEAVQVTVDDLPAPVAQWRAAPYTQSVAWASKVGTGRHVLKAQARDTNGMTARAELAVDVSCAADTECAAGSRCCPASGKCNPIVARGADCDCDHPCPTAEGCFPGTCGALPRKCRPGCFPGGQQRGQYADRCSPETQGSATTAAYCSQLPAGEATTQNKGGACAPADGCSITAQNCPDAPLDKNKPAGAGNPVTKYSCEPVSPTTNTCLPAGGLPLGGTGCSYDTCGDNSKGCQRGYICVTSIDLSGNPLGPSTCSKQCSDPDPMGGLLGGSPDCPSGQYCGQLLGPGLEQFPNGSCSKGL